MPKLPRAPDVERLRATPPAIIEIGLDFRCFESTNAVVTFQHYGISSIITDHYRGSIIMSPMMQMSHAIKAEGYSMRRVTSPPPWLSFSSIVGGALTDLTSTMARSLPTTRDHSIA